MKRRLIIEIISSLLIILWMYAALTKLFIFNTNIAQLKNMPFIKFAAPVLGWLVPAVEIIIALLLVTTTYKTAGLWASLLLLSSFTLYLLFAISNHSKLPCSCGGIISKLNWSGHIIMNVAFIALTAFSLFLTYSTPVQKHLMHHKRSS